MIATFDWHNLYRESWKGEIVPEAFSHPAKYSRALIRHVYQYAIDGGLLRAGDAVVDPFGGVALGALDAMRTGLDWTGVELEERFATLGGKNIALWTRRYARQLPGWGAARLLCGDSRNLGAVICSGAAAVVSSPPYSGIATGAGGLNTKPPRDERDQARRNPNSHSQDTNQHYGTSAGQLSSMREGDYSAVISSPPYEAARVGDKSGQGNVGRGENYGASAGQLGAMAIGDYRAVISSPPFEDQEPSHAQNDTPSKRRLLAGVGSIGSIDSEYGATEGQLGTARGDDFWSAARIIVGQVHRLLAPNGVAIFVVKDFVRNKERVPFGANWKTLCEACGFETFALARAWLVEEHGTQLALDGNHHRVRKERKSFFRRLAEKNGAPKIDYEQVWFMRKA